MVGCLCIDGTRDGSADLALPIPVSVRYQVYIHFRAILAARCLCQPNCHRLNPRMRRGGSSSPFGHGRSYMGTPPPAIRAAHSIFEIFYAKWCSEPVQALHQFCSVPVGHMPAVVGKTPNPHTIALPGEIADRIEPAAGHAPRWNIGGTWASPIGTLGGCR